MRWLITTVAAVAGMGLWLASGWQLPPQLAPTRVWLVYELELAWAAARLWLPGWAVGWWPAWPGSTPGLQPVHFLAAALAVAALVGGLWLWHRRRSREDEGFERRPVMTLPTQPVLEVPQPSPVARARAKTGGAPIGLTASGEATVECDARGVVLRSSPGAEELFGASPDGWPLDRFLPDLRAGGTQGLLRRRRELTLYQESTETLDVEVVAGTFDDQGRFKARLTDITERRARIGELERLALNDTLTGLANRQRLNEVLPLALAAARENDQHCAVMLIDLDRFKQVNDTFGHHVGDMLLQAVGPRLQSALRDSDLLARLGGDEFAIVLPSPCSAAVVSNVAERLLEAFVKPFEIERMSLDLGLSVGSALFPEHGEDEDALMQNADAAMYQAKRGKCGHVMHGSTGPSPLSDRLRLQKDLRVAIEAGDLDVVFQPRVDARKSALCGAEALVRWNHPQEGAVPPSVFVPLAEQTGLIKDLTLLVLGRAIEAQAAWATAGIDVPVSVNLSPTWFRDHSFAKVVALLAKNRGGRTDRLILEFSEAEIMSDPDAAIEVMNELIGIGVELSLDDFGTGRTSLQALERLPLRELKIDASFVAGIGRDHSASTIVRSIVGLAQGLGLRTVAEGVEREAQALLMRRLNCDSLQGFHYGKPTTAERFAKHALSGAYTVA